MAGSKNARTEYNATRDGNPNCIVLLIDNCFFSNDGATANKLVKQTIAREYVVAKDVGIKNKYTKTGTVKILPPPPKRPINKPITIVSR